MPPHPTMAHLIRSVMTCLRPCALELQAFREAANEPFLQHYVEEDHRRRVEQVAGALRTVRGPLTLEEVRVHVGHDDPDAEREQLAAVDHREREEELAPHADELEQPDDDHAP